MSASRRHWSLTSKENCSLKTGDPFSWRIIPINKIEIIGPSDGYQILLENAGFCQDHLHFQEKAYKTCPKASWNTIYFIYCS